MSIKILGIDCSPRKKSNSGALLEVSAATANEKLGGDAIELEVIRLRDYAINHCLACGTCGTIRPSCSSRPCGAGSSCGARQVT